jgi:hypothetical protein
MKYGAMLREYKGARRLVRDFDILDDVYTDLHETEDKYRRLSAMLERGKKDGLLTINEYWDYKQFLAEFELA